jgi:ABC-type multidrug transport system ATPase subunit
LSPGEIQHICIARALMGDPLVLLLDEPFAYADPQVVARLRDLFSNMATKLKLTVLLVTHNVREAFSLSDYVGMIQEGRIVDFGSKSEIVKNSENKHKKIQNYTMGKKDN